MRNTIRIGGIRTEVGAAEGGRSRNAALTVDSGRLVVWGIRINVNHRHRAPSRVAVYASVRFHHVVEGGDRVRLNGARVRIADRGEVFGKPGSPNHVDADRSAGPAVM